jgi:hypothetical protein
MGFPDKSAAFMQSDDIAWTQILGAEMTILLDLEILVLLSNTRLYVFQRLPKPCRIVFAFVIIVVALLHILENNVILLLSHVERTILSGNRLARLLRTIPVPKQTSAELANNSENFQSSARS